MKPIMYIRREQAAEYLSISQRTLTSWMQRKLIPYRKIGGVCLFRQDELDEAINRYRSKAIGEGRRDADHDSASGKSIPKRHIVRSNQSEVMR